MERGNMTMIYHITTPRAWRDALRRGDYRNESLETEGFIHCSTSAQIVPVADLLYQGGGRLYLLKIDPALLSADLKWEPPAGQTPPGILDGDLFPHIYGPLNLDAVVKIFDFEANPEGKYTLPQLD
jgi:uncharacterized protein (DUF952 family)